jgi:LacI family transcriptional regulator
METLEQEGLSIPGDISIIGCDDIPNLHLLKVPLSTIALPVEEIGTLAARTAIKALKKDEGLKQRIVLEPQLKMRGSAKPPQSI